MPPDEESTASSAARTVAAIDIGSNALRMVVADVLPDGQIEILERLQRAVRLGQDTFRRGRLGSQSMRAAVAVLRDYGQLLKLYQVEQVRAVATSALREASNADTFLDRVFMATNLQVEVIASSEESRLTVSAVMQAVGGALGVGEGKALFADVGGGSTMLTLLENGEIATSQSLRLGSIRLQEVLLTAEELPDRSAELLRQHISKELTNLQSSLPLADVCSFVAVGGDARFAAQQIGQPTTAADLYTIEPEAFDKLVDHCRHLTAEELSRKYGLPFAATETLNPALLVYQLLLKRTQAPRMIVSRVSMRDGLLLELARRVTGKEDKAVQVGAIHSAMAIAVKYHTDLEHARTVAELAACLFDEMQPDHGLRKRHRLLLRVAGVLHEVGGVVSNRAHHKHSYYLINNSEIFGLTRAEIEIVAHVARYHRRSGPKPSHVEYMSLPRETRVVVNKLAAILRVADALARGHLKHARDLQLERQGDELLVYVPGGIDLLLERRAIAAKGDLFEDIYGMKIRLEES